MLSFVVLITLGEWTLGINETACLIINITLSSTVPSILNFDMMILLRRGIECAEMDMLEDPQVRARIEINHNHLN